MFIASHTEILKGKSENSTKTYQTVGYCLSYNDFNCGLTCFHQHGLGDLAPMQQYGKLLPGTEPKTNEANIMQTGAFECFVLVLHI